MIKTKAIGLKYTHLKEIIDTRSLIPIIRLTCSSAARFLKIRSLSSVGRASPLQGEGHWFKPSSDHHLTHTSSTINTTHTGSSLSDRAAVATTILSPYKSNTFP